MRKRRKHPNIDEETEDLLRIAMEECDEDDRSTEFMIQYMQDVAQVDHDTVMEFLENESR